MNSSKMEVTFANTFDDVVALNAYSVAHEPALRRRRRWSLYGSPLLLFVAFALLAHAREERIFVIGGAVAAIVCFMWNWQAWRKFPRKGAHRALRGVEHTILGKHAVAISADSLTVCSPGAEAVLNWSTVFEVARTPEHLFIFTSPVTALIIPRREVEPEAFEALAAELARHKSQPKQA